MSLRDLFGRKKTALAEYDLPTTRDMDHHIHRSSASYSALGDANANNNGFEPESNHAAAAAAPSSAAASGRAAAAPPIVVSGYDAVPIPVDLSPSAGLIARASASSNSLLVHVISSSTPSALPPSLSADATTASNSVAIAVSPAGSAKKSSSRVPTLRRDDASDAAAAANDDSPSTKLNPSDSSAAAASVLGFGAGSAASAAAPAPVGVLTSRSDRRLLRPFKRWNNVNFVLFFALLLAIIICVVVASSSLYVAAFAGTVVVCNAIMCVAFTCRVPVPNDEPTEEEQEEEDHGIHAPDPSAIGHSVAPNDGSNGLLAAEPLSAANASVTSPPATIARPPVMTMEAALMAAQGAGSASASAAVDDGDDDPMTPERSVSRSGVGGGGDSGMGYGSIDLVRHTAAAERDRLAKLKRLDRKARKRVHKSLIFYTTFSALVALLGIGRHFIFNR